MRCGLGLSWCFDSLEAQACRPYNLDHFGEDRVSLKNQVLPKHGFFRALFLFFRASGRVDPTKPGNFSQVGVFFGRVPLKNKVLSPDTVGFDGFSRDN